MKQKQNIIFFGTPEFAAAQLENMIQSGYSVVAAVTASDKPAGRGKKMQQSAVKTVAIQHNIPVLQPEKLKDSKFITELESYNASLFVVIAFRMLPETVWRIPYLGTINLHASLLPNYRGAAPINRAIMNGEKITGLTTFFIDDKIDEGKIIKQLSIEIGNEETAGELHDRMIEEGKQLMIDTLDSIFDQKVQAKQQSQFMNQDSEIKFAPKIFKDDCRIHWKQSIDQIFNQIRGLSPYPAAFTSFKSSDGQILELKIFQTTVEKNIPSEKLFTIVTDNKKYLKIALTDAYLVLLRIQQPGKKSMEVSEFLRGFQISSNLQIIFD